jgi:membrane associated rhomboid family serine protease
MRERANLMVVGGMLATMVVVYLLTAFGMGWLNQYGLLPRSLRGLVGIFTMPFLHAGLGHLLANLSGLVVLLAFLLLFHSSRAIEVLLEVTLLGGLFLWLVGRPSVHVGASLMVYGLAGFLIAAGISQRKIPEVLAAAGVVFLYGGSLVWGLLPIRSGVSWEGHLVGLIAGWLVGYYGDFSQSPSGSQASKLGQELGDQF